VAFAPRFGKMSEVRSCQVTTPREGGTMFRTQPLDRGHGRGSPPPLLKTCVNKMEINFFAANPCETMAGAFSLSGKKMVSQIRRIWEEGREGDKPLVSLGGGCCRYQPPPLLCSNESMGGYPERAERLGYRPQPRCGEP